VWLTASKKITCKVRLRNVKYNMLWHNHQTVLFFLEIYSSVAYYGPYTSCQSSPTSEWEFGSGPPIRSWLRSIVPLLPDSPTDIFATPKGLVATFTRTYSKEYLKVGLNILNFLSDFVRFNPNLNLWKIPRTPTEKVYSRLHLMRSFCPFYIWSQWVKFSFQLNKLKNTYK